MLKINELTKNLTLDKNGIWISKQKEEISYPEDGNELCAEIETDSFWFNHRNQVIKAVVESFPPSGAIFDIGGGNGFVARFLEDSGYDCVLVEPGGNGSQIAHQRGLRNIVCATLESAEFKKNSIPSIGLFDVLEHIKDDASFLLNLNNLMTGDGKIYLTVPAYNFLWSNEDDYAGHYRRYTRKSIVKVFENSGFKINYISSFFCLLPMPIFLLRTIPSFIKLNSTVKNSKTKNEHSSKTGILGKLLNKIFDWELSNIKKKSSIFFGASIVLVAEKNIQ